MAIRAILVPVDPDGNWLNVLEAALIVARRFESHISVLHVAERASKSGLYNNLSKELKKSVKKEESSLLQTEADVIRKQVEGFAKKRRIPIADKPENDGGISISFHFEKGNRIETFVHWARLFDTTAVMRPSSSGKLFRRKTARTPLEVIMMQSGRPLLVVPPNWDVHKAQHAVVAWNHSLEATRAVAMTLPWLVQMKKVTVVSSKARLDSAEKLVEQLAWHGAKAVVQVLNRRTSTVAKRLLKICENEGADFLVMGGYSHSRIQERVFGGVTEYIMRNSNIITVMVH